MKALRFAQACHSRKGSPESEMSQSGGGGAGSSVWHSGWTSASAEQSVTEGPGGDESGDDSNNTGQGWHPRGPGEEVVRFWVHFAGRTDRVC